MFQILAGCIAYTLVIQVGINLAFSAILLPQVMDPDSSLKADKDEATWIGNSVTDIYDNTVVLGIFLLCLYKNTFVNILVLFLWYCIDMLI